ncbi:MAG: hypothetical protein ABIO44_03175, partial [Saprospiraceae bacterium]
MKKNNLFNKCYLLALICLLAIGFNSCVLDPDLNSAKTEITLVFSSGPLANKELKFTSNNKTDELQFYISKNTTRVFVQPLISAENRGMSTSSSINLAW